MIIFDKISVYIRGSVRIKISGDYLERFLNILAANRISFWDLEIVNGDFIFSIILSDLKKVIKLRKNANVKIKFIGKKGFPFIAKKYKLRYGMFVGAVIFFLLLNFMSTKLWDIKIYGNSLLSDSEVRQCISQLGVSNGMSISRINTDYLKQNFILSFKNVSWASFNIQGSVLEVNIKEFEKSIYENKPSNLISIGDAIIKKINVKKGAVQVKIGDTVEKGSLLVSGTITYGQKSFFTSSEGEIIGEMRYNYSVNIPKILEEKINNGIVSKRKAVSVLGVKIPLYFGSVDGFYEKDVKTRKVKIFGGEVPITIFDKYYNHYEPIYKSIDINDSKLLGKNKLLEDTKSKNFEIIKIESENIIENDEFYNYNAVAVILTDITKTEYFSVENP